MRVTPRQGSGGPPKKAQVGEAFQLRSHDSAVLEDLGVTVTIEDVDFAPPYNVHGICVFPKSTFNVLVQRAGAAERLVVSGCDPNSVCGVELALVGVSGEDDATWLVTVSP